MFTIKILDAIILKTTQIILTTHLAVNLFYDLQKREIVYFT